jgi:hypothetical protein
MISFFGDLFGEGEGSATPLLRRPDGVEEVVMTEETVENLRQLQPPRDTVPRPNCRLSPSWVGCCEAEESAPPKVGEVDTIRC